MKVLVIGAGIGGLTLALELHAAGIECKVVEQARQLDAIGVGINVLPHASARLAALGLDEELAAVAVTTQESVFYNRFGQLIYREPAGRAAGHAHAQYSVHRGDLQDVLLAAVRERLGPDAVRPGLRCVGVEDTGRQVTARFDGAPSLVADVVVGCDGVHSAVRKQLHPGSGELRYSGVNMWRGVTVWPEFLTGASMVRAGWLATGKLVAYPIRERVDAEGRQLVNWVAEVETPQHSTRDWNRRGQLADFAGHFADWRFDWLDVPALLAAAETVLEYPMVDQDPLDRWSFGRVTLLGDAAHPMVPRGSNGAGQAILDAGVLAGALAAHADPVEALAAYERERLPATAAVVLANRTNPPDAILREVYERTGDRPFARIEDVIGAAELAEITARYRKVAGVMR